MRRRDFLRVLGTLSGGLFMSSCGEKESGRKLISYALPPDDGAIPGIAYHYPSACTECPAGCGFSVKVREGWPIKLEGAIGHPVNRGGLCIRGQASLSRLYHPERIKKPLRKGPGGHFGPISWEDAFRLVTASIKKANDGKKKNYYLAGRTTGYLDTLIDSFCRNSGIIKLPWYETYPHSCLRKANLELFGVNDIPLYKIDKSDFLLTLGPDILETFISPVNYSRDISEARKKGGFTWYHVEPHMTLTGANAHKRISIPPGKEKELLIFLLKDSLHRGGKIDKRAERVIRSLPFRPPEEVSRITGISATFLRDLSNRLFVAKSPLVIAGGVSTAGLDGLDVARYTALLQVVTGQLGNTVDFSTTENYGSVGSFNDMDKTGLILENEGGGTLFVSRANPLLTLPLSSAFRKGMVKAEFKVGMAHIMDETMGSMDLILPLSHPLESWDALEPRIGLVNLVKPIIKPLFDTLSEGEILLALLVLLGHEPEGKNFGQRVKSYVKGKWGDGGLKKAIEDGFVFESGPKKKLPLSWNMKRTYLEKYRDEKSFVLYLAPSIRTFDGRSGPLELLSEVPDPLTTVTYGKWVSLSAEDSRRLGVNDKEELALSKGDWSASLPVKIQPGLPEGVMVVHRDILGPPPVIVDPVTGEALAYLEKVEVKKTGKRVSLPVMSGSFSQEGRGIIPEPVHQGEDYHHRKDSIYPEHEHLAYRWAMAVDLDLCTGCSACVAACYIENNVPVVGKGEHLKGREMSWIRIEPYYEEDGSVEFIPMLCQQCHYAPCEPVCPVYATYHNPDGLNVQVFNRCVGTRYCSNNCPYKVRRFNWFTHRRKKPLDKMVNPDILVRTHGVMEKCTFCIQRIRVAKDGAKDEKRMVKDGEVATACGQSCPMQAITFGNLLDEKSKVYALSLSNRAYRVYEGLGTEPSVYYLRKT